MESDIIFSLRYWQLHGHEFIDWCVINVGRETEDWEKGVEFAYVPTVGQSKYAMIRIYDDSLSLLFRMKFAKYISTREKEAYWTILRSA